MADVLVEILTDPQDLTELDLNRDFHTKKIKYLIKL